MDKKNTPHIKCVLLGDANVGKTSIINRYLKGEFCDFSESTIGCSYNNRLVETDKYRYKLDLWDTAGQERYRGLMPMYYRNADLIFLCVDLSQKDDKKLNNVYNYWKSQVFRHNNNDNKIIILIGTKSDCKINRSIDELRDILDEKELTFFETSAKDDIGIKDLFSKAVDMVDKITYKNRDIVKPLSPSNELIVKHQETSYLSFCSII